MSAKLPKQENGIDALGYVGNLNQIKQGIMILNPASGTAKSLLQTAEELDNAAWVDFSEIRYFLEPTPTSIPSLLPRSPMTARETERMQEINSAGGGLLDFTRFYNRFVDSIANGVRSNILFYLQQKIDQSMIAESSGAIVVILPETGAVLATWDVTNKIVPTLLVSLPEEDLADIVDIYCSLLDTNALVNLTGGFFPVISNLFHLGSETTDSTKLFNTYSGICVDTLGRLLNVFYSPTAPSFSHTELWTRLKETLKCKFGDIGNVGASDDEPDFQPSIPPIEYPFIVFPVNNFNLGLRLVYRQEWRPLGVQRGEIVKTIPLGPKQTEKVSTKIMRRTKVTKTSESLKSTESTTEASDTAKDSSEILNEASSALKWNVNAEAEGSFDIGVGSAGGKMSTDILRESTDRSKETSSYLSETMRKVANKVRTETKVVVSTESETTFEATTASEIQNPNDEIAITYIFSKLQRQYDILTRLAEVQNVIMVAEDLPAPDKIDFNWVKRYDWIIAKVLLDDSFREALNSISQDAGQPDMKPITDEMLRARNATIESMGKFASTTAAVTAQNIDFAGESQKNYLDTAKEQLERNKENYLLEAKKYRLLDHIRDNILHYYRAIWQQEDPQQRLLRYRKQGTTVPLSWQFQPDDIEEMTVDKFINRFGNDSGAGISGHFVADSQEVTIPLVDLINPAGPIAFYGNYAVYYMRPEFVGDQGLMSIFDYYKTPYVYNGELMDPVQRIYIDECDSKTVSNKTIDQYKMDMIKNIPELKRIYQEAKVLTDSGKDPQALDEFLTDYKAFRGYYDSYLILKATQNKEDMVDHIPDLKLKYLQAKARVDSEEDLAAVDKFFEDNQTFRDFYPEYLFRMEMSRRFLVDTNCLMIDLLPGEGSTLEPFKQMHRVVDVLKAEQELIKARLDNERRKNLLDAGKYGDPDIEKVVVVSDKEAKTVAGLKCNEN